MSSSVLSVEANRTYSTAIVRRNPCSATLLGIGELSRDYHTYRVTYLVPARNYSRAVFRIFRHVTATQKCQDRHKTKSRVDN